MRLLICAGGTGGGVYPALAVLQELDKEANPVLWVGSQGGMEAELIKRTGIPYGTIPAAGLHGVGWQSLPGNSLRNIRGIITSTRILRQFKPDLIFLTGGYVTAPMAIAARIVRTPALLFSPDIEPGLAVKITSRMIDCTAVPTPNAKQYYPPSVRIEVTGYPIRSDIKVWTKENSLDRIGLNLHKPVLLFMGGSKGARSINRALINILPQLLEKFQIVHISGKLDWQEVKETWSSLTSNRRSDYHIFDYLHEDLGAALASADLAISRAGASTLGEYPYFGLPAILVPYPHAWRYQKVNAAYLENKGAALTLSDHDLQTHLLPLIKEITSQPGRLEAMSQAMQELQPEPSAAKQIAKLAQQIASKKISTKGTIINGVNAEVR